MSKHPVDVAIIILEAAREKARLRRLEAKRKVQDAAIAAQIPDHPW